MYFEVEKDNKEIKDGLEIESHQKDKIQKSKIKTGILFLSQTIWFIYILIFVSIGFIFPRYHNANEYVSLDPTEPFNKEKDPIIYTHVSDIHLSACEPLKVINTKLLLKQMKKYKVNFHIISGDIVDNYGEENWPKIGRQIKEDWELFQKMVYEEELNKELIIDCAGNHDMWALIEPLSKEILYLDYSFTFKRENIITNDEFLIKKINIFGLNFIIFNNYRFPTIHPPYIYYGHPTKDILDKFEKSIETTEDPIIITHYPVDINWGFQSSKGNSFEKIIQNKKIKYIYTGHFHPANPHIIRHEQGGVEYVGIAAYQYKGFSLVTIDNGRHVYHPMKLYKEERNIFITHPIPLEEISSHQIFNEKNTYIRVISYFNEEIDIYVKGYVNGKLNVERKLKNGAYLYSIPLNVDKDGEYEITVYNNDTNPYYNFNIKRKFYIGQKYFGKKEGTILLQRGFYFARFSSIATFLCLFIILFPIKGYYIKSIDDYICGLNNEIKWNLILFLSPLIMRYRIQKVSKIIRLSLFCSLIYILILPLHFFKPISGYYGFSFFIFTYLAGTFYFDEWAVNFFYFYLLVIIIPAVNFTSSLSYSNTWVYKFNKYFMFLMLIGISIVNYRWVGESVIIPLLFINPTFVVIPCILQIIFYFTWYKKNYIRLN